MNRMVGTVARGIRAPIVQQGDDLEIIIIQTLMEAYEKEGFKPRDKDVFCMTEAVVARAFGNYATVGQLAMDVRNKLGGGTIGLVFPILSRNRFALCLEGIARAADKIVLLLSYPQDEVGNGLISECMLEEKGVNPWSDLLTQEDFERLFGKSRHEVTGMDYVGYYREIIEKSGAEAEIIFANDPKKILDYAEKIIACDIHTREKTKKILKAAGAKLVLGLDNLMNQSVDGSGYNEKYGILGSNRATGDSMKLFPNNCQTFVETIQKRLYELTGKHIEVMVYGDGAFKDPTEKIWELADPVVSPGYTAGLEGSPDEIKLKYLADNQFAHLRGKELSEAIAESIRAGKAENKDSSDKQGTTPRKITDLLGSLCDLVSGSGDKGTPFVYIQGYFDSYADDW